MNKRNLRPVDAPFLVATKKWADRVDERKVHT
jgi:hypothetical protein